MRRLLVACAVLMLLGAAARAEEQTVEIDVSALQEICDGLEVPLDAGAMLANLADGGAEFDAERMVQYVRGVIRQEFPALRARLILLIAPALLWAVSRHLLSHGEMSEAAGFVCFLCAACVLLSMVREYILLVQQTLERTSTLTARFFPVLSGLLSASGAAGAANAVSPAVALMGGVLNDFLCRAVGVLCSGAAVTAAAGNLTERMPLQGLFRLFCTAGSWLLGGIMALFGALISFGGVVGAGRGGAAMKTVKYAVGTLLPLVGGEVAGTMDVLTAGASSVCAAAGVTGVIVMLLVCLRPAIRLILGMLCCMLASALTEPIADGALRRCMDQIAQVVRLLLAACGVNAVLFIVLTGTLCA